MAELKQVLVENILELGDSPVNNWIFGCCHKFYYIRKLFKREMGIAH
jgi:hypothetical protein